jgi:hypothetical protein
MRLRAIVRLKRNSAKMVKGPLSVSYPFLKYLKSNKYNSMATTFVEPVEDYHSNQFKDHF